MGERVIQAIKEMPEFVLLLIVNISCLYTLLYFSAPFVDEVLSRDLKVIKNKESRRILIPCVRLGVMLLFLILGIIYFKFCIKNIFQIILLFFIAIITFFLFKFAPHVKPTSNSHVSNGNSINKKKLLNLKKYIEEYWPVLMGIVEGGFILGMWAYLSGKALLSVVAFIFLGVPLYLLILLLIKKICNLPLKMFTRSSSFKDGDCLLSLLLIPAIFIEYVEITPDAKQGYFMGFPLISMLVLLFMVLYRVGTKKIHVANKQKSYINKIATVIFFMIIQIWVLSTFVIYFYAVNHGLSRVKRCENITWFDKLYFVCVPGMAQF